MALKEGIIHCGDSFKLLKRIAPGTVRLILTDPPYNVSREHNFNTMGRRGIEFEWDGNFDQVGWLKAAVDALIPWGSIVIFNDYKNLGQLSEALRVLGVDDKGPMHWFKTNPWPRNMDRCTVGRLEYAIWGVKPGPRSTGQQTWVFNRDLSKSYEDGIFYHPVQRDPFHDTKKPDGLWEDIIKLLSNKGDLVVDPFAGVGTLAVAAERLGRRHISIEMDWVYTTVSRYRLEQTKKQLVKV